MLSLVIASAVATSPVVDTALQVILLDYPTARIEAVGEPKPLTIRKVAGLVHCYRINAKNQYGGYDGWRRWWLFEANGRIVRYGDDRYYNWRYCGIDPGPSQN